MAQKKWTGRDWYQYHKEKAVDAAISRVARPEIEALQAIESEMKELSSKRRNIQDGQSLGGRLLSVLFNTSESRQIADIDQRLRVLQDDRPIAAEKLNSKASPVAAAAAVSYYQDSESRSEEQAKSVDERHNKYLERIPSMRSAQPAIKRKLIDQQDDAEAIPCYYCGVAFHSTEIHLEHKTPIVRGGSNKKKNVVLACASCNLKKGARTEAEFRKFLERN